jgi:hypothetical protein
MLTQRENITNSPFLLGKRSVSHQSVEQIIDISKGVTRGSTECQSGGSQAGVIGFRKTMQKASKDNLYAKGDIFSSFPFEMSGRKEQR